MKDKKRFKYEGRDASDIKKRRDQTGGAFDSFTNPAIPRYKVGEGENNLRILPPSWDINGPFGNNWGIEIWLHNQIGVDKSSYLCHKKMNNEECFLCEARKDVAEDDDDDAKALAPGKRILTYVIDREDEKSGPLVWAMPWTLERDIQSRSQDKKTGESYLIDHPEEGYDIYFTREGKGLKTKYLGVDLARGDGTPISDNEKRQQQWLDFISENPLPDILKFFDNEYLKGVFMGKKSRKDEDDVDADKEEKEDKGSRRGRRSDDNEEDERPKRSRRDEPEEDERPKRSSRDDEDETPKRSRRDADEDERPKRNKDDDEDPPKRSRRDDPEDDDPPKKRRSDDDEDSPKKRSRDDDNDPPKKRSRDEDEDPPKRSRRDQEDESEDDDPPKKRSREDEDEDERPSRARSAETKKPRDGGARSAERDRTDEDEDPPKKRSRDEEDDDPPPKKSSRNEDEDDPPKKSSSERAKASMKRLQRNQRDDD